MARRYAETDAPLLPWIDPTQQRQELIRPFLLCPEHTATQRAQETGPHPDTGGRLKRPCAQQGMLGLVPDTLEVHPARRQLRVPDTVVQELQRLQGLDQGCRDRALARLIFPTPRHRITGQTARRLWDRLPPAAPPRPLLDSHRHPAPASARLAVITLQAQGWSKRRLRQFLPVSRPTINLWLVRCEAEQLPSLEDRSRAPHTTGRQAWLPMRVAIQHRQTRHPEAGGFRLWRLRGKTDLSVRTVERIMALNRQVYPDIPGTAGRQAHQAPPQPHPCKASAAHASGCIDGRMMEFALAGHRWWSLILLDGYARTRLAGAVAPSEASWGALTVLSTACQRYGVPSHLIADSGGACISDAFAGGWTRLEIDHQTIVRTQGQSSMHLLETHCNMQRRLQDYQLALTRTPCEFAEAHQRFLALYTTTAHQGLLQERFASPIPLHVLGDSKGRLSPSQELTRQCAQALLVRTPTDYGCVTLPRSHCYVDQGRAQTPVLLGVAGEDLRAVYDHVLVAEYACHDDLRTGKVTRRRLGPWYPSPLAARRAQGTLRERTPRDAVIVLRPPAVRRLAASPWRAEP